MASDNFRQSFNSSNSMLSLSENSPHSPGFTDRNETPSGTKKQRTPGRDILEKAKEIKTYEIPLPKDFLFVDVDRSKDKIRIRVG